MVRKTRSEDDVESGIRGLTFVVSWFVFLAVVTIDFVVVGLFGGEVEHDGTKVLRLHVIELN